MVTVVYQAACLSVALPSPSRVGQRGSGGLSMSAARSEHEVSEIIDGLSEQEVRVIPAPLHPPFCSSLWRPGECHQTPW